MTGDKKSHDQETVAEGWVLLMYYARAVGKVTDLDFPNSNPRTHTEMAITVITNNIL